jgi:hypothetical protein
MRDVMELLRTKEQELLRVKRQIEALRIAAPLLSGEEDSFAAKAASMAAKNPTPGSNT